MCSNHKRVEAVAIFEEIHGDRHAVAYIKDYGGEILGMKMVDISDSPCCSYPFDFHL